MKSKKYSEALLNLFKKKGFKVKEFENIIESKIIIERSGEIFKKSLLSFEDEDGKSFSLRPDLTISACNSCIEYKFPWLLFFLSSSEYLINIAIADDALMGSL